MKALVTFILATLWGSLCPAAELRGLKVLYVGNATSARAADFKAFLSTNVARVEVVGRVGFDPAIASSFDVVLLDWSQADRPGGAPPRQSPLGERNAWTKPTVLLGSAGLHMATVWNVKGGFG
jgi:hypothetical protein